jgi:hypothetical protein
MQHHVLVLVLVLVLSLITAQHKVVFQGLEAVGGNMITIVTYYLPVWD